MPSIATDRTVSVSGCAVVAGATTSKLETSEALRRYHWVCVGLVVQPVRSLSLDAKCFATVLALAPSAGAV